MMNRNEVVSKAAWTKAIGRKGIFLALALAGAAFQGCTTEDKPTDNPATATFHEDEKGADLKADGTPVNPDPSAAADSKLGLAKLAPTCVELVTTPGYYRTAQVTNRCFIPVRIRFIWRFAPDGQCRQLKVNETYKEKREWPAYLTEVRDC